MRYVVGLGGWLVCVRFGGMVDVFVFVDGGWYFSSEKMKKYNVPCVRGGVFLAYLVMNVGVFYRNRRSLSLRASR